MHEIRCSACADYVGTSRTASEAEHLAGVHDQLWHGGSPTATTDTLGVSA